MAPLHEAAGPPDAAAVLSPEPAHSRVDLVLIDLSPDQFGQTEKTELLEKIALACRDSLKGSAICASIRAEGSLGEGSSRGRLRRLCQKDWRSKHLTPSRVVVFDGTQNFAGPDLEYWDGVPVLVTHGLTQLLKEPALKRPVWNGIQMLFAEVLNR